MRVNKIILVLMCSMILIGCNSNNVEEKKKVEVEDKIDTVEVIDENTMKNLVAHKNDIKPKDNSIEIKDLDARNKNIKEEYLSGISLVKGFCESNSLTLTYEEPLKDRISRFDGRVNDVILLRGIYDEGAETINYFTDNESLNVDLSIGTQSVNNNDEISTYSHVVYKSAIENINDGFKFKDSKLNEFRNTIVHLDDLDFEKIDKFIGSVYNGQQNIDMRFFNRIDDNRYEIIRVENNNCYYKLVYDPLI